LAGIATVTVDGVNYLLSGDFTYRPSTVTRETLKGQDTVHGYKEMPESGMISGTFRDASNMSVATFNAMTNVTVVCQLANGKIIIGRNMWTVETQEVKTEDGTFEVKWESQSVTEN
jgi:Phage tail tube protein.